MSKTFVDQCLSGAVDLDEIDDFVARWHNDLSANMPLNEYLGFSQAEYRQWAEKPQSLADILSGRKSKTRLETNGKTATKTKKGRPMNRTPKAAVDTKLEERILRNRKAQVAGK